MSREAMQMALDALENSSEHVFVDTSMAHKRGTAIDALRAALAVGDKPETSEPVAWRWEQATWPEHDVRGRGWHVLYGPGNPGIPWMTRSVTPLYTSPALPPGWVAVPVEPTQEMLRDTDGRGLIEPDEYYFESQDSADEFARDLFRSMIAAAPKVTS